MKQKTAVDWLVEKFNQCEPMYSGIMSNEHKKYLDGLIEQAKAMEKEQIINALPTDQDIDNYVDNLKGWVLIEKDFFRSGAKFMRNIIKNNDAKEMRNL